MHLGRTDIGIINLGFSAVWAILEVCPEVRNFRNDTSVLKSGYFNNIGKHTQHNLLLPYNFWRT